MLSRLKRRAPSSGQAAHETDSHLFDGSETSSPDRPSHAPVSPTLSAKSRGNGNAQGGASARTLSPSRANMRPSRSSSFSSLVERPKQAAAGDSRFLVINGPTFDGSADIGQGSLRLEHLGDNPGTLLVQAPELIIATDAAVSRASVESTDPRTPIASNQDRPLSQVNGKKTSRGRSHTNAEVSAASGLSALADINVPSSDPDLAERLGQYQSSSLPGSLSASRSVSRAGSRRSSVADVASQDAVTVRPPSVNRANSTSRSNKKLLAAGGTSGDTSSAIAVSSANLVSASPTARQTLAQGRNSTESHTARADFDLESELVSNNEDNVYSSMDHLGDFDDVVSQLGTGYAVASSKRNAEFHAIFRHIPDDDYLIEDYGCALQREILIQGRLYISEHHLSFNANIFGWVTTLTIPFAEVVTIEKRMTAYVIPNAIQVTTLHARHTFASFLSRDTTYDLIGNIWRMIHPVVPASAALPDSAIHDTDDDTDAHGPDSHDEGDQPAKRGKRRLRGLRRRGDTADPTAAPDKLGSRTGKDSPRTTSTESAKIHEPTVDTCATFKNLKEVCMDATFPSAPEKIYNLMFTSGFMKEFWSDNQKLQDIQISDWAPEKSGSHLLARSMSYIKPLSAPIGPKQTKCVITDENAHVDFDDFVCVITTTRTPDVPSGTAFAVKTRTSLTWARNNSCRVLVTTGVEWTKSSFIKGIVERSCIDGQRTYHADLEKAMRAYITQHRSEFLEEGQDAETQAVADTGSQIDDRSPGTVSSPMGGDGEAKDSHSGDFGVTQVIVDGLSSLSSSPASSGLALIVLVLILSNLWTLSSRSASSTRAGLGPPSGHAGSERTPDQVALAVRDVLRDYFDRTDVAATALPIRPEAPSRHSAFDTRREVEDITAVLDSLEERLGRLRASLAQG